MKKLLTIILALAMSATGVIAQQKAAAPAQQQPATATAPQKTANAKHLKKDGTPDKRYKENKKASAPKKKDGTPDMRYKENKEKAKKKS
ncbi:hypothetical protein [Chitinophaga sp.]|uniref:hypothetical protein n=1 Tax=Chitinophaga sp. TaxID=1869181 RepID=UPI0031D05DF6